jgi:cellulose synthase/poly-beta-1,6-N-acetylglucosamine synthase-like glycosyltransferase
MIPPGNSAGAGISVIVPSLGQSPWQGEMLAALRRELAGQGGELIWVHQGEAPAPRLDGEREFLVRLPLPAGFAFAANTGLAAASPRSAAVAIVNDDLVVEPGWLAALAEALESRPGAAAVQGVHFELGRPSVVEGCGLGWNRSWQAVQVGAGEPPPAAAAVPFELFGVSATAALYRRAALEAVAGDRAEFFDERLGSYYEDVELAVRLQAAGWESWCVPAARAGHAGQATAGRAPMRRWRGIYRNRLLVLRRLLGGRFTPALPGLVLRDAKDFARAVLRLDGARAIGLVAGWGAALPQLGRRSAGSAPASECALAAAERFRIGSPA